ncbi:MAG: hypothetical protein JHC98_07770 [Thermoleophilaceae bacterium]|nr:hypothetical protein [Thermoleophilaceae bacterium]
MDLFSRSKAVAVVNALAMAVCLFVVSGAGARVATSVTTSLTQTLVVPTGITGATTTVTVPATKLGQHADFNLSLGFSYGATGTVSSGVRGVPPIEDPATYIDTTDFRETVKQVLVDIPPGLVGNPNAIPYDERCPIAVFENGNCPASSTIGSATVVATLIPLNQEEADAVGDVFIQPEPGGTYQTFRIVPQTTYQPGSTAQYTRLSLLQTDQEVPAKIGLKVLPPLNAFKPIHQILEIAPDTDGDLRLRTDAPEIAHQLFSTATDEHVGNLRISSFEIKFPGRLSNGNAFMTNPTSCTEWTTTAWARSYHSNTNLDSDPRRSGTNEFAVTTAPSTVLPDCSNSAAVPFPAAGKVTISSPDRDTSPAFDFVIDNPGIYALDDNVSTSPKRIVTTIPASLNVDVQQLGRVCQLANFKADSCPATSRVGSVKIETPLLRAGLTGDVYLVKQNSTSGLPDLGLRVRGAITFTQLGKNRYVGAKYNQIETTFDEIPQVGFSKLSFHLDGGANGLLRSLSCPTYNKAPALPNFTYNFTAWTGATSSSTTPLNMKNCFGIQQLKRYPACLHKKLPIHPNYQSRSRLRTVTVKIDGKKKASSTRSPFRFDLKLKKLKLKDTKGGRHTFELKATYDDGTVSVKKSKFKVCR